MVSKDRTYSRKRVVEPVSDITEQTPDWLAVASLAISTFTSVTTEFLPIGLLTSIAGSLDVTEGVAGLMVTMPGLIAALAGPVLIVGSGRLDRRAVLIVLSSSLVVSNLIAAFSTNLMTMLFARFLLGLCVGGFWTFAPSAVGHFVSPSRQARAMSYVLAGISAATVAGVPAGVLLGNLVSWRVAFGATALMATIVLIFQLRILPAMPIERAIRPRDLFTPLLHKGTQFGLAITFLLVAGHFTAYTYFRPILQRVFGLSPEAITSVLLLYGVAGLIGTFLGGRLVVSSVRSTSLMAALMTVAVLFFSALVGGAIGGSVIVAVIWGVAFGLVPVSMTTWMLKVLPDAQEAGQALMVSFFQMAISFGALVGGLAVDSRGINFALFFGGGFSLLAAAVICINRRVEG